MAAASILEVLGPNRSLAGGPCLRRTASRLLGKHRDPRRQIRRRRPSRRHQRPGTGRLATAPPGRENTRTREEAPRRHRQRRGLCRRRPLAAARWGGRREVGLLAARVVASRVALARERRGGRTQGYGSTEGGGISIMINRDESSHIGSAGRVSHNVEVKIVDIVTGEPLSAGQKGELCVRGPSIMTGYIGDDEANAAAFDSEGWLKTGDLCYIDHDGFLFVVDRLKELIKYKAYQVPPAELELVLQSLPEIVDAAVMPYPHEEAGQIPMALVVRQPGSKVTEAQVMEHVAKQVAPYKKIRKVVFVDSIPKSPAGKILRRQLSDHLQSCHVSRL